MTALLPARWSDILGLGGPSDAVVRISDWVRYSKAGPSVTPTPAPREPLPVSRPRVKPPADVPVKAADSSRRWASTERWRELVAAALEHIERYGCVSGAALGYARGETNRDVEMRANAIVMVCRKHMPGAERWRVKVGRCWSAFYGPRAMVETYYAACGLEPERVEEHRAKMH
jgi:hypothetical protein